MRGSGGTTGRACLAAGPDAVGVVEELKDPDHQQSRPGTLPMINAESASERRSGVR